MRLGIAAAAVAVLASGCGVSLKGAPTHFSTSQSAAVALPARPVGEIDVDGSTSGSLTGAVATGLGHTDPSLKVVVADRGESAAFSELCAGQIDIVDSTRPILPSEFSVCKRNRLAPVQFEVAAVATVLATQNNSDVGVDCLTASLVDQIFRAGSTVTNWQQVHGFDIPLTTAGPRTGTDAIDLFSQYVLGIATPTLAAFRPEYRAEATYTAVRNLVTGNASIARTASLQRKADNDLASLRAALRSKQEYVARLASEPTAAAGLAVARSQLSSLRADVRPAVAFVTQTDQAAQAVALSRGYVGIFPFTYYELFEDQLRPIEIDSGAGPGDECIFPSQTTVTNGTYPLSHPLLLTTTAADLRRPEVQQFLRTYLHRSSQLAQAAGIVPLASIIIGEELGWVNGTATPLHVFYAPGTRNPSSKKPGDA
jgi:ABC-type phosphate transport system substrate-binding protein